MSAWRCLKNLFLRALNTSSNCLPSVNSQRLDKGLGQPRVLCSRPCSQPSFILEQWEERRLQARARICDAVEFLLSLMPREEEAGEKLKLRDKTSDLVPVLDAVNFREVQSFSWEGRTDAHSFQVHGVLLWDLNYRRECSLSKLIRTNILWRHLTGKISFGALYGGR